MASPDIQYQGVMWDCFWRLHSDPTLTSSWFDKGFDYLSYRLSLVDKPIGLGSRRHYKGLGVVESLAHSALGF
jgi:hypothetical protein